MKNFLLTSFCLIIAVTGFAQNTMETANDMKSHNVYNNEQATEREQVYWKYTAASSDEVILATTINNSTLTGWVYDDTNQPKQLEGAAYNVTEDNVVKMYTVFPAPKGKTVYISAYGYQYMGFDATFETSPSAGKGYPADNYATIVPGQKQLFSPGPTWRTDPVTAKITPERDGVLKITSYSSASYVLDEAGVQYIFNYNRDDMTNVASVKVTGGKENTLSIYCYGSIFVTSEMTYPTPGDFENPFAAVSGANTLPQAAGTYWYVMSAANNGMLNITGSDALNGGQVSIYDSPSSASNNRPLAQSSVGSFNVSARANAGTTYYIKVEKASATDADQTFDCQLKEFAAGDTEDNPITISDFTQEFTVPAGKTVYYTFSLASGVKKRLIVAATSEVKSADTKVSVYQYSYSRQTGNDKVNTIVEGGGYTPYKIEWVNSESADLTFKATLEDLAQGDDATNPLEAQLGENTLASDGTKYYIFKSTQSGKLEVTMPEGVTVSFPKTATGYGNYDTTVSGNVYSIDAADGTVYNLKIEGAKKGGVFSVAYGEWAPGEAISTAIEVADGVYTMGSEVLANNWIKYTAKNDGFLTIDASSIEYSYSAGNIYYCTATTVDNPLSVWSWEDGMSVYKVTFAVTAGTDYYVQFKLNGAHDGATVKFIEREPAAGETVGTAISIQPNVQVEIPQASTLHPVWVKFSLDEGDAKFTAGDYIGGYLYKGKDNALADISGGYFSLDAADKTKGDLTTEYTKTLAVTWDMVGDYYLKIMSCSGCKLTISGDGIVTAVSTVSKAGEPHTVGIYSVNGAKLPAMQRGINLVKMSDGSTRKIILK